MKRHISLLIVGLCTMNLAFAQLKKEGAFFEQSGATGFLQRVFLNQVGEKWLDILNVPTLYNTDGSFYKTFSPSDILNSGCVSLNVETLKTSSYISGNNYDIVYKCDNGSVGVADENGLSFFNTNQSVIDYRTGKSFFLVSDGELFGDTSNVIKYYGLENDALKLQKTFTETRNVGTTLSEVKEYDENSIFQIKADNTMNVFDKQFKLLFSLKVPMNIAGAFYVAVRNVSQYLYNYDDDYEFSVFIYDNMGQFREGIYNQKGEELLFSYDFIQHNAAGTRLIAKTKAKKEKAFELPDLKPIISGPNDIIQFDDEQNLMFHNVNLIDGVVEIKNEKTILTQKLNFSNNVTGHQITNNFRVAQQPDGQWCTIASYDKVVNSYIESRIYRVTFPDGKTQDIKGYNDLKVEKIRDRETKLKFMNIAFPQGEPTKSDVYVFTNIVGTADKAELLTNVTVFPNPFENNFTIQLPNETVGTTTISISNQLGQIILQKETDNSSLEIKELADIQAGIYFITVQNEGKRTLQKIVKK